MTSLGHYFIFLGSLFRNREPLRVYPKLILDEMVTIGTESFVLVAIVSSFIGAVTAVQTAHNMVSPLIPNYVIGTIVRDMTLLELATTFTCVILSGKVGSSIAGGLGTMRITEQIDALEVMGVNSASYLVLPKVIAALITFPMLVVMAGFLSLMGGYLAGTLSGLLTETEYIYGIRSTFDPYNITFALIKSFVFAFLISSISAYKGYFTRGGALEVGRASTEAVTNSCIAVLLADYALAQLLL
ncbi:phospholipid/cholesterol/gamma-HCH transport system permease protein [Flexibacter flexilis DSM 6793]|uniref:Phospholipid/cholesterol/gamma-HCH transport system permease protein n=1 Tax=Flexibacter flexilis DSM 6793 TaxID=927664 RepID=A0A1I1J2F9_9BACT|nr:ABC transporter permease [Flexibacter flexilis]SFC42727.1 phospholipid/cholesterol/gamma-HCH transport system permease protein [Flexibacter flexilis DSM 6793]